MASPCPLLNIYYIGTETIPNKPGPGVVVAGDTVSRGVCRALREAIAPRQKKSSETRESQPHFTGRGFHARGADTGPGG